MPGLVRPAIVDSLGQEGLPGSDVLYVAPGGSDANPGTLASPKATLQGAHDALPGSPAGWTIVMRGGDYALSSAVAVSKSGSSGNPVRVQAYPEETVRLHRGGPFWYLRTPGSHWEVWDAGKGIYRTTATSFTNGQRMQGYVRIGGHPFALSMMAPGDFGGRFQSNGSDAWLPAAMTGSDGRLYLRVQVRPEHVGTGWPSFVPGCEAGDSFAGVTGNPNDLEVCVRYRNADALLQFAGGVTDWDFYDINVASAYSVIHFQGVANRVRWYRGRSINIDHFFRIDTNTGPLSNFLCDGHISEMLGDSSPIAWSVIKGTLWGGVWDSHGFIQPAWNRNSGGENWTVRNSLIAHAFDFYNPGSRHPDGVTFEHNWFWRVRDDGRQGNLAARNVRVRFNVFEDSPWGLGDFSGTGDGNYEVAHNLFLMRTPWHWGTNDPPIGPSPHTVYPTHWVSGTKQSPEQHHNNSYVLAAQAIHNWSGVPVGHVAAESSNSQPTQHEHYNNIYCTFEEREYKGQNTGGENNSRSDFCIRTLLTIGNETHNHCHFARASTRSTPRTGLIQAQNQTGAGNGVQTFASLAAFQSSGINSRGDHANSSQDADAYGLADAAAVNAALPFVDAFGLDFRLKSGHAARSGARGGTTGWRGAVDPDTGLCPDGEPPGPIGAQDGEPDPPPAPEPTPGRQRYLAEALGSQTHSSFAHQVANQLTWTPDPDAAYLVLGSIHVGPIPSGLSGTLTQLQRGDAARSADTRGVHPAVSDDAHTWPILLLDVEAPSPSPASVTWRQVWRGSSDNDVYRVNNARLLALRLEEGDAWARSDTQVDLSDGTATTLATATAPAAGDYLVLASIGYRGNLSPGGADFWVEVDGALLTASRQTAQPSQGTTGDPGSLGSTYTVARVATLAEGDPVALRGQRTVASGTLNTRYARVVLLALGNFFGHTVVEGLSEVTESAGTAATVLDGARNSPAGADHLVLASVLVETQSGRDDSAPTEDAEVALVRNASPLIPTRIGRARTGGTDTPTTWLGMTVSQALGDDAFALTLRSTTSGRTVAARGGSLAILQLDPLGGVTAALAADEAALAAEVTSIEAVAAALAAEEAALDAEATLGLPPETTEAEVVATSTWNTGGSSVASLSWTHDNPATVNLLLVAVRADLPSGSTTTYTVTYGGETMTRLDGWNTTVPGAGGGAQIDVFHLWDPPSGENTVSITPAASRQMHGWAIGVRNADAIEGSEVDRWDNTDDSYGIAVASEEGQLILAAYGWRNSGEQVAAPSPEIFTLETDQGINSQNSRSAIAYGHAGEGASTVVSVDVVDPPADEAQRAVAVIVAVSGTAASHDVDAALAAGEATLLAEVEAELTAGLDAALEAGEAALAAGVGLHDRAVSARIEAGEAVLAAAAQLGAAPVATPHPIDWVEAGIDRCRLSYGMEPCRALLAGAHAVQHSEDFASQDLGSPPAGWTARWGLDPEVVGVAADGDATGGRLLRAQPVTDNRRLLSIDALDGHAQVDQTWRLRSSSTAGAQLRVVARASGSSAETHRAYAATLLNGSSVQIHRIVDGAFTLLGNITHSWAPDAWQRLRLQVAGDHVRCRVWQDGAPEPTYWQVDAVDPTPILDGGWSGLSWFAADGVKDVDLVAAEVGLARHKCFNSWPTCQDPDAFDPEPWWLRVSEATTELPRLAVFAERGLPWWLPLLVEVRHSPVRVDPGRSAGINAELRITLQDAPYHDMGIDKYVRERGLDPAEHGTLWLKMLRRFRHLSGRVLRWHRGFIGDPATGRTRHYVIEKVDGPNQDGRVTITAKDPLRLTAADRAQAPRPSRGRLLAELQEADEPASIDVETPDPAEYPAEGGIVFLGSEGVQYESASELGPTTVRLEGITRGLPDGYETVRRSHEAGAAVQLALYFRDRRVPDIIDELLTGYVPRFDPAWIPKADWDREYDTFFAGLRLRRLIAKPEGVRDLLNELVEQTLTWSIWWDEAAQRVRIAVVRPPDIDEELPRLLDGSHLLSGTVERLDEPDRLVNEVEIVYGQRDPTGRLETRENYARARLRRDLDSQSAFELGQVRLRRVFARWHPSGNTAFVDQWLRRTLTTGLVQTFRLEFDLPRRDGEGLAIGDFVQVETTWIIDDRGLPEPGRMQLLKVEPGRQAVRCTARSDIFEGIRPFARIAPGELAGLRHAEASEAQRLRYLFVADAESRMSDGSQGYRLL